MRLVLLLALALPQGAEPGWGQLLTNWILAVMATVGVVVSLCSLRIATTNARRELRAYVGVQWKELVFAEAGDLPVAYAVMVKNSGRTPAVRASCSTQMRVMKRSDINAFDFPERHDGDPRGPIVISADDERRIESRAIHPPLTANDWEKIRAGKDGVVEVRLYCWGVVRYHDVFGKEYWGRYCFMYGGSFTERNGGRAALCHRHNDTSDFPAPDMTGPPKDDPYDQPGSG
jgi:hypothetical protein